MIITIPANGNRLRVVLGDDNADLLQEIGELLSPEFDLVGAVENGKLLVAAAQSFKPDVVVTDINMPEMDGIDAARRILALGFCDVIVALSVTNDQEIVKTALDAGIAGYVLKENAGEELVHAIHSAVQGKPFLSPAIRDRTMLPIAGVRRNSR
jgi:DNA-binding NarL/FixJ family response regulator